MTLRRILPEPAHGSGAAAWPPLFDTAAARALEAQAAAALPPGTLMQRAGLAVARLARAIRPHARQVLVLAGPGNNGGDGYEAALHLHALGHAQVQVLRLGEDSRLPADARAALARAVAAGVTVTQLDASGWPIVDATLDRLGPDDLLIDALLGRGLARPAAGAIAELITRARAVCRARAVAVLAVDLPSGLPADTGALPDTGACLPADVTLALLSLAPGVFTAQGRALCGAVWFDALGVTPDTAAKAPAAPVAWLGLRPGRRPGRSHASHKGRHGDLWVVGGAAGMVGAATLAARAGLSAGAGRVYLQHLGAGEVVDLDCPELMHPGGASAHADTRATRWSNATVVAGCGGGEAIGDLLPDLLAHAGRLVLDADALNQLARSADPPELAALAARADRRLPTVITPHPLEAARLLGCSSAAVQADRLAAAQALAARCRCVVVLKGSGSIVAAPGCRPIVNTSGNAALATAGSGDVLAGWLGGLWSQQAEVSSPEAQQGLAHTAVWMHGHAAETASPDGQALPASRLIEQLGAMLRSGAL